MKNVYGILFKLGVEGKLVDVKEYLGWIVEICEDKLLYKWNMYL